MKKTVSKKEVQRKKRKKNKVVEKGNRKVERKKKQFPGKMIEEKMENPGWRI